jgi:D-arabinose 1-dehydrogenase-like Zn-dependent alcohol dehydrogenase
VLNDIPIPEPGEGQLLVKIKAASLCHSDLIMGIRPDFDYPVTMGHEGVGIVEKLHPSVESSGFKPGQRVGLAYIIDCCFSCEQCMYHNLACPNSVNGGAKVQGLMTSDYHYLPKRRNTS